MICHYASFVFSMDHKRHFAVSAMCRLSRMFLLNPEALARSISINANNTPLSQEIRKRPRPSPGELTKAASWTPFHA
jgi:hypothetical protein